MLFGFVLLAMTTAAVASLFVREDEEPQERREQTFEQEVLLELRELAARIAKIETRVSSGDPEDDAAPDGDERRGGSAQS
jgi:voltage-gated potassium channel